MCWALGDHSGPCLIRRCISPTSQAARSSAAREDAQAFPAGSGAPVLRAGLAKGQPLLLHAVNESLEEALPALHTRHREQRGGRALYPSATNDIVRVLLKRLSDPDDGYGSRRPPLSVHAPDSAGHQRFREDTARRLP